MESVLVALRPLLDVDTAHPDPTAGVLSVVVGLVPGVAGATLSRRHSGHALPRTVATTNAVFAVVDAAQFRAGRGPTIDVVRTGTPVLQAISRGTIAGPVWAAASPGLRRWPPPASRSMTATTAPPLSPCTAAGPSHPTRWSRYRPRWRSWRWPWSALTQHHHVRNLRLATASNRRIGIAMGILMAADHSTAEQAFDALARESQARNRICRLLTVLGVGYAFAGWTSVSKTADLAEDIILAGVFPGS